MGQILAGADQVFGEAFADLCIDGFDLQRVLGLGRKHRPQRHQIFSSGRLIQGNAEPVVVDNAQVDALFPGAGGDGAGLAGDDNGDGVEEGLGFDFKS